MLFSAADGRDALFGRGHLLWHGTLARGDLSLRAEPYRMGFHDRLVTWGYVVGTAFLQLCVHVLLVDGYYTYYWGRSQGRYSSSCVSGVPGGRRGADPLSFPSGVPAHVGSSPLLRPIQIYPWQSLGFTASFDFLQNYGVGFYPVGYLFAGCA